MRCRRASILNPPASGQHYSDFEPAHRSPLALRTQRSNLVTVVWSRFGHEAAEAWSSLNASAAWPPMPSCRSSGVHNRAENRHRCRQPKDRVRSSHERYTRLQQLRRNKLRASKRHHRSRRTQRAQPAIPGPLAHLRAFDETLQASITSSVYTGHGAGTWCACVRALKSRVVGSKASTPVITTSA